MSNPNDDLLAALGKLEEFTQDHLKEKTRFEEVKELLQTLFFAQYRREKEQKARQVKKELIKSVGLIKTYLPLIDRYRHGTAEEQKFAALVLRTIDRYNESMISLPQEKRDDTLRIETGPRIAYQRINSEKGQKIDALFRSQKPPKKPPSQEEVDTLKMKAIRLIEGELGLSEALIETFKDQTAANLKEISSEGKTITLMQTWSELPGEVHRIVGAFRREAHHSIPIKDSFKLFLESTQPGHPYPSQRMGWSLSHWLIPSSVLWIDQVPLLMPLIERKKRIAEALLPKGHKNSRARKLFRMKKGLFEQNPLEYLSYTQELAHAILRTSHLENKGPLHTLINTFFDLLSKEEAPFDTLCQATSELNRVFIEAPFEKIEEKRLKRELDELFDTYRAQREEQEALWEKEPREETPFNQAKKSFLFHMGHLLGDAAALLLQLQLSEKLKIKPPPLSDFELKIQAAAFLHLIDFLKEMEDEEPLQEELVKKRMFREIASEIELFSAPTFEEIDPFLQELTEETVSYFHARFHAND